MGALKAFHKATEFAPGAVDGFFYLASTYFAMGELEAATDSYRKVAEMMPKDAKAHSNLGVCLSDSGKHEEALKAHGQALELRPKDAGILANAAKAHLAKNTEDSVKEAAKHFKALLKSTRTTRMPRWDWSLPKWEWQRRSRSRSRKRKWRQRLMQVLQRNA